MKSEAKGLKVFCVVGFCITAALFISQIFFNMCANFSPILYRKVSEECLSLNIVRNGDAVSSTSNPIGENGSQNTTAPVKKNFHSLNAHVHQKFYSERMEDGRKKRKYFPKILHPPKQRRLQQSPSPSINSVASNLNPQQAKNTRLTEKNPLVTAVVVNEQCRPAEERYLLEPKRVTTNSSV